MSNSNTLGDVIRKIAQEHGEKALLDSRFTLAIFMDLAPNLKKEKELLRSFLLCNGAKKIITTKSESYDAQEACMNSLIGELKENHWLSEDAAKYVCSEFYKGLTNQEWIFCVNAHNLDVHKTVTITNPVRNNPIHVSVEVDGKAISVPIPDSVSNGETVCFPRKGKHDLTTGQTGDLYVTVHIHTKQSPRGIIVISVAVAIALLGIVAILASAGNYEGGSAKQNDSCVSEQPSSNLSSTIKPNNSHAHSWRPATYNDPQICNTCGATEGSKETPSSALNIRDIILSTSASSVYAGDNLGKHSPEKMYDGKLDTNWTENASGNGIGEYAIFYFDDTYAIKKMHIYIGSHYSEAVYAQNCRPKVITLTFSDGSTERILLEDSYDEQTIVLDKYYYTDYVKLIIEEVYAGTKYLDTVIAELDFVAYRP